MSVGIAGDSRLYKQSSQEIPLPSPIPYVKILTNSISDENGIKMPSFFGYMLCSLKFLIPVFIIDTLVFFL